MAGRAQAGGAVLALMLIWSEGAPAACSVSDLGWMTGNWKRVTDRGVTHEHWIVAPSGGLLGFTWGPNLEQPGDVVRLASIVDEQGMLVLRLRHYDGALRFIAGGGDNVITFDVASCGRNAVTFEGVGVWKGDRATYTRDGDSLIADGQAILKRGPAHYKAVMTKE